MDEGKFLQFTITALDPGDILSYSAEYLPPGASLNADTGEFTWTTDFQRAGSYEVPFTVTDNCLPSLSASSTITITVNNVSRKRSRRYPYAWYYSTNWQQPFSQSWAWKGFLNQSSWSWSFGQFGSNYNFDWYQAPYLNFYSQNLNWY